MRLDVIVHVVDVVLMAVLVKVAFAAERTDVGGFLQVNPVLVLPQTAVRRESGLAVITHEGLLSRRHVPVKDGFVRRGSQTMRERQRVCGSVVLRAGRFR